MRTRNRFLPALLIVLAALTLAALIAPNASARMLPPVPNNLDRGDPDGFPLNMAAPGGIAVGPTQGLPAEPPGPIPSARTTPSSTVLQIKDMDIRELCHILFLHILARR
jgi:hypothetical protein